MIRETRPGIFEILIESKYLFHVNTLSKKWVADCITIYGHGNFRQVDNSFYRQAYVKVGKELARRRHKAAGQLELQF